jgi:hypothetical protein
MVPMATTAAITAIAVIIISSGSMRPPYSRPLLGCGRLTDQRLLLS